MPDLQQPRVPDCACGGGGGTSGVLGVGGQLPKEIAAGRTGRNGYAAELEPRQRAIILPRWEAMSGRKASSTPG